MGAIVPNTATLNKISVVLFIMLCIEIPTGTIYSLAIKEDTASLIEKGNTDLVKVIN